MSYEDKQKARELLQNAEQRLPQITNAEARARLCVMIAQGWCQVAQADR